MLRVGPLVFAVHDSLFVVRCSFCFAVGLLLVVICVLLFVVCCVSFAD